MTLLIAARILAVLAGLSGQADDPAARTRAVECRDGDTITVRIRVSSANQNLPCAVSFPDLLENVVSSWSDRDLSMEVQGAKLFLKLLAKTEGHLDVLTTGGMHLRLYLKPAAAGEEYDGHLVLKAIPEKTLSDHPRKLPEALELVKAMRLGLVPPGASVKRGGGAVVTSGGDVEGKLAFVYETTAYRGYVIRLANKSPKAAYHLDVTRFNSPRLVLIGAQSLVVAPEKSTLVYLVLWK